MKREKKQVRIVVADGEMMVAGWELVPGLAVIEIPLTGRAGFMYGVTHVASGWAIGPYYQSYRAAAELLRLIKSWNDWTLPAEKLTDCRERLVNDRKYSDLMRYVV